jgi:3-oxoacyl-(acyl-carrier-protein) synthase
MVGDTFSAAGIFNTIASLGAMNENFLPPTMNYEIKDERCDLDYVPNKARQAKVNTVLVNAFTPTGVNSSLMVGKV